tara:strand:- start:290 stop:547 length:258 start_codon:yes stop_codon:yes gene_type:complete
MTPFMQLTLTDGTPTFINILQVVLVEPRKSRNTAGGRDVPYTYIVLSGGESITRNVTDSYDSVMEAIIGYHKNKDFVAKSLSPKV